MYTELEKQTGGFAIRLLLQGTAQIFEPKSSFFPCFLADLIHGFMQGAIIGAEKTGYLSVRVFGYLLLEPQVDQCLN
jgi:hypothetical protein